MNYAESFDQFASKVTPTDLALYAGAGLILFVLFKDKLSPVQKFVQDLMVKAQSFLSSSKPTNAVPVVVPTIKPVETTTSKEDIFFKLVVSWKQTRDLALECGCTEAIKVADQMFPYLSPVVCGNTKTIPSTTNTEVTK